MRYITILCFLISATSTLAAANVSESQYKKVLKDIVTKYQVGITDQDLPWLRVSCDLVHTREQEKLKAAKASGVGYMRPIAQAVCDGIKK